MALTICEDAWNDKRFWNRRLYTVDPVEALVQAGRKFRAEHFGFALLDGQARVAPDMLATIARSYNVPVVMVNQVGGNDSLVFDGSSLVLDRQGKVIAQGKSFEEDLVLFDTDHADRRNARADRRRGAKCLCSAGAGHPRLRSQMRISER